MSLWCILGWHDWWEDYNFGTRRRKCLSCYRWQALKTASGIPPYNGEYIPRWEWI